ncbi:alpha/beta hydrolase [Nocardiopsis alba]|uniref:alpha/beta hydrolase n=1 Tax=Nocardiopsis alba TaxID=53437 RepID=UPI0005AAE5F2|nr:alpha/beta hydrolase [Nocardiopsis alba]
MRFTGVMVLGGVATLLLAGCAPPSAAPEEDGGPADFALGTIDWEPCKNEEELAEAPEWDGDPEWLETLECGTLDVPLDHADPGQGTIGLAMVRRPAEGADEDRIGSLVLNPGGPGETGVDLLDFPMFDDPILSAFDLVSFDPRGVGDSGGFACGDWFALDEARSAVEDPTRVSDAELGALEEAARDYADDCAEEVGEDFLAAIGTVNVVRDLDLIREALGDERLSYVGFSYGTYIGALYAEMYPENTRALVLDGAVETERPNVEVAVDQAEGFQYAWDLFVEDCSAAGECPFSDPAASEGWMADLLEDLDADPPMARDVEVDGATLMSMISQQLYYENSGDLLAATLTALDEDTQGAGEYLDVLYDDTFAEYEEESDDWSDKPGMTWADEEAALTAINCADRTDPTDADAYRRAAQEAAVDSPLFGSDLVWEQLPCAYWPDTEEAPSGFTAPDAPPIVVVGTLGDPATPYTWAEELAGQLDSAVLLTYEGTGHTAYAYGDPCVDPAVDSYLLTGGMPEEGLSCPAWEW